MIVPRPRLRSTSKEATDRKMLRFLRRCHGSLLVRSRQLLIPLPVLWLAPLAMLLLILWSAHLAGLLLLILWSAHLAGLLLLILWLAHLAGLWLAHLT